jgi:hypothetical protein
MVDIEKMKLRYRQSFSKPSPSISSSVTFDIEHLRYRYTIPIVKNVDIKCTFDIDVFDIDCYARYRRSDTRLGYRGGKDPDEYKSVYKAHTGIPVYHDTSMYEIV